MPTSNEPESTNLSATAIAEIWLGPEGFTTVQRKKFKTVCG